MDKKMMNKLEDLVTFLKEEYENKIDVNIIKLTGEDRVLDLTGNEIVDYGCLQSQQSSQWNFLSPMPGGWNFVVPNFKDVGRK